MGQGSGQTNALYFLTLATCPLTLIFFFAGCAVIEQKTVPMNSAFDLPKTAQVVSTNTPKSKGDISTSMKGSTVGILNGAGGVIKGAGDGAGWVVGEFVRPFSNMRDWMINTFGVEEKNSRVYRAK